MRVAVYSDLEYHGRAGVISTAESFVLFALAIGRHVDRLTLVGRLSADADEQPYVLPDGADFVALPYYPSLARPWSALTAMARSLGRFWRVLGEVDAVWLLGPHPLAITFAGLARLRGRRVVLGTRQDMPAHMRNRHPDRRDLIFATLVLETAWRLLGRQMAMAAVGSQLAAKYPAGKVVPIVIPLVDPDDIVQPETALHRSYDGELTILSVGRVEPEKNPVLLAEILALARERDPRWRMVVCGEGTLTGELAHRVRELGLSDHVDLRGHVALDAGLRALYRDSHAFLHVSLTEGVPQVLFEAFAGGLPVVATDVGGVADVATGAAVLVPPGRAEAAAYGLARIASEPELRRELIEAGAARLKEYSLEAESLKVVKLLRGSQP